VNNCRQQSTLFTIIVILELRYRLTRRSTALSTECSPSLDLSTHTFIPSSICTDRSLSTIDHFKRAKSPGVNKKIVRFADSVGLELVHVQYIRPFNSNDQCQHRASIKENLYGSILNDAEPKPWSFDVLNLSRHQCLLPKSKRLFCLYRQPNSEHPDSYLHEVWQSQIKLEHADIRVQSLSSLCTRQYLDGTLWVTNGNPIKCVTVKYTFNQWLNTYDYKARYRCHSNDFRNLDQFEFTIDVPHDVDRVDFVLRYYVNEQEYWDNNRGNNYTLQCDSSSIHRTTISLPHDCDFNEMRFY
jgi:protein phosphatase 1 regulatory subunit 3A/B/C/D/E